MSNAMAEDKKTKPAGASPAAVDPENPEAQEPTLSPEQALKQERDEVYDRLLRTTAEFDNYRKRIDRERRDQSDRTVTDLLLDLLAVMDDFERALAADADKDDPYRKGIELIRAKLQDVLQKRGVRPIDALGADFDPNLHEAVLREPSPGHRDGEVIGELRRGYMMGDRLLRASIVKVATRE
jgi:molecular chaperone GrpE